MKLTDLSIRKLKHPEKGQKIYFDDSLPGFGIRLSQKSKSFVVVYGKQRNTKTLGKFSERGLSLSEARKKAKHFLATQPTNRNPTLYSDAVAIFLADCEHRNRPETIRQYRHYLSAFEWKKKVADITRVKIQNHLQNYKDHPYAYVHGLTSLKVFFNWCIRQEIIDKNPLAGERAVPTASRERVLSTDEIKAIWKYEHSHFSTIVKLCLLTGQRRSEIAAIVPDWIQEDVISFPATVTKNGRRHTIPISPKVVELLEGVPFGKNGAYNGWSNGKRRMDKYVRISHWTLHDLRRTFSTIHAELGTPIHITERLLNHASGSVSGVTGVYNRYSYLDEMRAAQEKYESCLVNIIRS